MICSIDPNDIKNDIQRLKDEYDVPSTEVDAICDDIDSLVSEYDEENERLKNEADAASDNVEELEEELNSYKAGKVETYASKMLEAFTGHEPNLGEVLSLKDDLEQLLTTKYHISLGNL